ncbi:MAG: Uma2 family endonuclease [Chloroflexota bacterium]|nr:Uma2 family endonuclease [Chloroflexota bacterium]
MGVAGLVTVEDVAAMARDAHRYDLIRGELRCGPAAGFEHGLVTVRISGPLYAFVDAKNLGLVLTVETGFVLRRDPDTLLAPDVSFVRGERVAPREAWRGFAEVAPDLTVEVVSPSDRPGEMREKIRAYLEAGVPLVWSVDPGQRTVTVLRPGREPEELGEDGVLDGGAVAPGFRLPVADLFR